MVSNSDAHRDQTTKDMLTSLYKADSRMSYKDSEAASYILEKTYRIASTCTRLLELMDKQDALAGEMNRTSIRLVRDATVLLNDEVARRSFLAGLMTLTGLLETAALSGKLSRMNVTLIENELLDLADTFRRLELSHGRIFVDEGELKGRAPESLFERERQELRIPSPQGQVKSTMPSVQRVERVGYAQPVTQSQTDTVQRAPQAYRERVQESQKDRRAIILGLLQKKDRITVKDVSRVITDVSEKTLQRELLALVSQGVLRKEGERRWSTYRLV